MAVDKVAQQDDDQYLLLFVLGNQLFSIELKYISRVISWLALKPVPGMPNYFLGLLNLEGVHIPILDGSLLYKIEPKVDYKTDTPILLCKKKDQVKIGLAVESTIGIIPFDKTKVQAQDIVGNDSFLGTINTKYGTSILIDVDPLINWSVENFND